MSDTKVTRLSDDAYARLLRLVRRTGMTRAEIISRSLDLIEGKCGRCGTDLAAVARLDEQRAFNPQAEGSIPSGGMEEQV